MISDQHAPPGAALAEWRAYWPLIFVSWVGCNLMGIPILSLGAFIAPLEKAFGWSHSEIFLALSVYAAVGTLGSPFAGRLLDRWGPRRVVLPGVILTGIAFGLLGTAGSSLISWLLLWLLYSLAGMLILMQAWTAAVASNFIVSRGLALAVTLTGSAFAAALIPRTAVALISEYSWRAAYGIMGAVWAVVGGLLVFALFRSKQDLARREGAVAKSSETAEALAGVSAREGLRSPVFVKLAIAAFVGEIVIIGVVANTIPMLTKEGMSMADAAWAAGAIGVSAVVGKLICGLLANRIGGQYIMAFLLALPIATALILLQPNPTLLTASLATALLGFSSGGQLEMQVYIVARHFGLKAFGTIFGVIGGVLSLAIGIAPPILGRIYDVTHSYELMLMADIPLSLLAIGLLLIMGDYPDQAPAAEPPALAEAAE
jgi:MFS family permease